MRMLPTLLGLLLATPAGADDWPDLSKPGRRVGGGRSDAAVIVGIERYAFVPPVPGAKQNALLWYDWLVKQRDVPAERVKLLVDEHATVDDLRQVAAEAATEVESGGTLWFTMHRGCD